MDDDLAEQMDGILDEEYGEEGQDQVGGLGEGEHAEIDLTNDSVAQFTGHADPVFNVNVRPVAPYDTFVSGDSSDKAYIWKI